MAKINIDLVIKTADAFGKFQKLRAQTQKTKASTEKLKAQTSLYNEKAKQQAARTQAVTDRLKRTEQQTKKTSLAMASFASFLGNVAATAFTKFVGGIAAFAGSSINAIQQMEDLRTQFEVLTGSAGAANQAVRDLAEFAAKTPFQLADLGKAQQRLLSFGFSLEQSKDLLGELGDVAAASNTPIGELSLIFGQVSAAGKLTGERLLQLQERAIPILDVLAKETGKPKAAIRDMVSQGKIDFATFEKAFKRLNDEGGFAFEGMVKRSQTLSGRISTLKDNFFLLAANLGQKLAPALKTFVTTLTTIIQKIGDSATFKNFLTFLADSIPSAINTAFASISAFIDVFALLRQTWSRIVAAGYAIVDTFFSIVEAEIRAEKAVKGFFGGDTTRYDKQLEGLKAVRDGMESAALSAVSSDNEIENSRKKLQKALDDGHTFVANLYSEEARIAEEQANAKVNADDIKINSEKQLTSAQMEEMKKREEALKKLAETQTQLRLKEEEEKLLELGNDQIFKDAQLQQLQAYLSAEQEAEIQAKINLAGNEIEKQQIITQARITAIDERRKLKQKELEDLRKAEEEYTKFKADEEKTRQATLRSSLGTISSLQNSQNKTLGAIGKAAAIANITISTQEGAMKAWSQLGVFGGPMAALIVAAGAASAAKVAGVNFEQGGIVPGTSFTGDNVSANVNSGEMILNRQQQSQLFAMANGQRALANQSQIVNQPIVIELDNEVVGRATSKWVANGGQLGEVQ